MKVKHEEDINEIDKMRMDVWLKAWVNVARSDSCVRPSSCTHYADSCLKDFEKRFTSNESEQ